MFSIKFLFIIFLFSYGALNAQKIDSIYIHLYTDSLKKGTYNYINIDGRLPNGRYLPLDSTQLTFTSSHGKFYGNNLWIDPDFKEEKINIHVALKNNSALHEDFVMYIKKKPDDQRLKTEQELIDEMKAQGKKRRQD